MSLVGAAVCEVSWLISVFIVMQCKKGDKGGAVPMH